jgi:hypothetical protein
MRRDYIFPGSRNILNDGASNHEFSSCMPLRATEPIKSPMFNKAPIETVETVMKFCFGLPTTEVVGCFMNK